MPPLLQAGDGANDDGGDAGDGDDDEAEENGGDTDDAEDDDREKGADDGPALEGSVAGGADDGAK